MQTPRPNWLSWAGQLHRWRLDVITAWMLEAGAPLALLGAQAFYFARPFLGARSESIAHLLEDENETRAFAAYLRGEALP